MKSFGLALIGAVLSAVYWWLVATVNYGLFGGDVAPDAAPPSETSLMIQNLATFLIGIFVYACLILLWHGVTGRLGAKPVGTSPNDR